MTSLDCARSSHDSMHGKVIATAAAAASRCSSPDINTIDLSLPDLNSVSLCTSVVLVQCFIVCSRCAHGLGLLAIRQHMRLHINVYNDF
jgi:hypothetical protein